MKICVCLPLALTIGQLACIPASRVPMNAGEPIEIDNGYRQGGQLIDPKGLVETLEREPRAQGAVHRSRTVAAISLLLAGAAGALIGWPLGQWISNQPNPKWSLAAVGGGVAAVAFPLAFWSDSSMNSAVKAHNSLFGGKLEP